MLSRDESGKASLDIKGMFLPLQDGDQNPDICNGIAR